MTLACIKKIIHNKIVFIILLDILLILGMYFVIRTEIWNEIPEYATQVGHAGEEQVVYYLKDSDVIEQRFQSEQNFDMVSLHLSDHDQSISGKTFISVIEEETGKNVYYEERQNSEIHYGELVKLNFEGKAYTDYLLTISFEGMGERGFGIFGFPIQKEEAAVQICGENLECKIAIGVHNYTNQFRKLVIGVFVIMCVLIVTGTLLAIETQIQEEYLFLGIAVPMGIAFLFFLSINMVHDGATHLAKVYHYSNVLMGQSEEDISGYVVLDHDEKQAFDEMYAEDNRENKTAEMYYDTIEHFWEKSEEQDKEISHEYRETSASSPLEYFPGILGMTLGRLLGGSARLNILLAKICFFLFYIGAIFWAIKISPYFKTVIAFTALLPMALYQATGITYDSIVIAIGMLIIALYFKARQQRLDKKEIIFLLILAMVLGCCKGGFYLPILFLFCFIPSEVFSSKKKKWKLCSGTFAAGGIGLLVTSFDAYFPVIFDMAKRMRVTQANNTGMEVGNQIATVVPETQTLAYGIGYAFSNPFSFIKMMISTLVEKADYYMGNLVGYRMAWSDITTEWIIIFLFLILVWMAAFNIEGEKVNVLTRERLAGIVIIAMEVIGFHILMLIETPIGELIIQGVQGRYFIIWVPILLLACNSKQVKNTFLGKRHLYCTMAIAEVVYLFFFMKIFFMI